MIYVRRDPTQIPERLFKVAERAQQKLEELPEQERKEFIRRKSHIWRAFARYLSKMSYGKCWYSESHDNHSFFDVDHFRPKLAARRSDDQVDCGYEWLAFSWENFRLSSQRSNRPNKNEENDELVGKADWFPLLENSPKACWENRCEQEEQPVLLDPTVRADVDFVEVNAEGMVAPSAVCIGVARERYEQSVKLYGLNLPKLVEARKRVMREVADTCTNLLETLEANADQGRALDLPIVQRSVEQLRRSTQPDSPFSKAARSQILALGMAQLCAQPEDQPERA